MKALTTNTRILFIALVILATFFLSQIPCLADNPLRDNAVQAPKEGVIESAAELVGGAHKVTDAVVVKPATEVVEGACKVADKVVVKPAAEVVEGACKVADKVVVKPATDVTKVAFRIVKETGKFVIKVLTFGIKK